MAQNPICYISLGSDCSVSYQLRQLGLQTYGSMPFDWMRIDSCNNLCDILESHFDSFLDVATNYDIREQSLTNFDNFTEDGYISCKSQKKLVHKKYKFTLPHEFQHDKLDMLEFKQKYSRRIARFNSIVLNSDIEKVFVRLEQPCKKNKKNKTDMLEKTLSRYITNFRIIHIFMDEYEHLIPVDIPFQWQRYYIPWEQILLSSS